MRSRRTTPKIHTRAKELRRNTTESEAKLWLFLRAHRANNVHFRRQHAIGNYIVDFCSPSKKLVVEVDGSQHIDQEEYDSLRSEFLQSKGYRVLRFWNGEVMKDIEGVMGVILEALETEIAPSQPSPNLHPDLGEGK